MPTNKVKIVANESDRWGPRRIPEDRLPSVRPAEEMAGGAAAVQECLRVFIDAAGGVLGRLQADWLRNRFQANFTEVFERHPEWLAEGSQHRKWLVLQTRRMGKYAAKLAEQNGSDVIRIADLEEAVDWISTMACQYNFDPDPKEMIQGIYCKP